MGEVLEPGTMHVAKIRNEHEKQNAEAVISTVILVFAYR